MDDIFSSVWAMFESNYFVLAMYIIALIGKILIFSTITIRSYLKRKINSTSIFVKSTIYSIFSSIFKNFVTKKKKVITNIAIKKKRGIIATNWIHPTPPLEYYTRMKVIVNRLLLEDPMDQLVLYVLCKQLCSRSVCEYTQQKGHYKIYS